MTERKSVLLRLDPAVHDALARWASDELRPAASRTGTGPPPPGDDQPG